MASERRDQVIAAALRQIARWIAGHAPGWSDAGGALPLFNPAASGQTQAELADRLGLPLPDDLRAMLLVSDGGRPGSYPLPMRATEPTKWRLLSAAEIAERWIFLGAVARDVRFEGVVRTVGQVRAVWWNHAWIPIADCGTGDVICIDMDPQQGGVAGQLILYAHDFAERRVLNHSALDWIRESADDIEADRYVYQAGVGMVAAGGS